VLKRDRRLWRYGRPEDPLSDLDEDWDFLLNPPLALTHSYKVYSLFTKYKNTKDGGKYMVRNTRKGSKRGNGQIGLEFERRIKSSFEDVSGEYPNFILFKIPDTRGERAKTGRHDIYTAKIPADFILITQHHTAFVECKSTNDVHSFRLKMIRPHQLQKSVEMHNMGHNGYFFIENRKPRGGTLYIVDGYRIVEAGKKTLNWAYLNEELAEFVVERERGLYDLSPFLHKVY